MLGFCSLILVQQLQFSDGQRKQQRPQNVARNRRTVGSGVVITSNLNMSCLGHDQAQLGRGGTVETSLKMSREIRRYSRGKKKKTVMDRSRSPPTSIKRGHYKVTNGSTDTFCAQLGT